MGNFQVPVIAVFTKFDQFRRHVKMMLEDEDRDSEADFHTEVENMFHQYYLGRLSGCPPFVRLESEDLLINSHPS